MARPWQPTCPRCKANPKPDDNITSGYCKPCRSEYDREYRARANHSAKHRLLTKGLTQAAYEEMLAAQGGRCAICLTTEAGPNNIAWHVDHDHACCPVRSRSCGKCIRGLLCARCNRTLGAVHDDPAILRNAADYLEERSAAQ